MLPNILSLNARSTLKKTEDLAHVIHNYKSDIVMVSETWLSDDIRNEALHFPGIPDFSVVRDDRVNKRGAGVAVLKTQFHLNHVTISLLQITNVYGLHYVKNIFPGQSLN